MSAKRIVLVDDHDVVRQGLAALISEQPDLRVVGEARSAAEALEVAASSDPDLVVVDLILGDGPDGIQLTRGLKAEHPLVPILVLSARDESLFAERSLLAGASGYLMKDAAVDVLLEAIAAVLAGGLWLSESMWAQLLPAGIGSLDNGPLDPFDASVLRELRRGNRTAPGVARELRTSPSEVERSLARACERLRLPSLTALILFVQKHPEALP